MRDLSQVRVQLSQLSLKYILRCGLSNSYDIKLAWRTFQSRQLSFWQSCWDQVELLVVVLLDGNRECICEHHMAIHYHTAHGTPNIAETCKERRRSG